MALQILNAPGSETVQTTERIRAAIVEALPGAEVAVQSGSAGHYEVRVRSEAFAGKTRVAQHQMVYAAITFLMTGDAPTVHAVDLLYCDTP